MLEGTLGQTFASLDRSDWVAYATLLRPLGFQVLLQSGLLKAIAKVSLRFSLQTNLMTYEILECGPNL